MRVLVVGGGTAGWITALMTQRFFRGAEVTLVQSAEFGILGAGEGTTPHFIWHFLDFVGIPLSALIQNVGATVKSGIEFVNWSGIGSRYHHPFYDVRTTVHDVGVYSSDFSVPDSELNFIACASNAGRVPFRYRGPAPGQNPLLQFEALGNVAVHFDAVRLARYLESIGRERGVTVLDGLVVDLHRTAAGDFDLAKLSDGTILSFDLLFDCSGFHRAILGKVLRAPWRDVTDTLPCDRAVPFFLPVEGELPPVTRSVAMKAGWAWQIPTQARWGCGYVFDSRFATDDEAIAEVKETFGPHAEVPRVFKFKAGYYEDIWINNVFGVGLSTGFLEPLEATSIWVQVLTLKEYLQVYLPQNDARARQDFHEFYRSFMQRIVDFLYLHYVTPRDDTPFWSTFRARTRTPPFVEAMLRDGGLRWQFNEHPANAGHPAPFPATAWMHVGYGNQILHRPSIERHWRYFNLHEGYAERRQAHTAALRAEVDSCVAHGAFLDALGRPARAEAS